MIQAVPPQQKLREAQIERDKGFFVTDKLTISGLGFDDKTFEFRGGDKAHQAHNIIMEYLL